MNVIEPKIKTTIDAKGTLLSMEVGDGCIFPYTTSERTLSTGASLIKKSTGKVFKLHRVPEGVLVVRII